MNEICVVCIFIVIVSQRAGRATAWLSDVAQIPGYQFSVLGGSVASAQSGEVAAAMKS